MQRIPIHALRSQLARIAEGGEGIVYRVTSMNGSVLKEYKPAQRANLDARALEELSQAVDTWEPQDRQRIATRTTWPSTLVVDQAGVCGFVMNELDGRFYKRYGLRANPRLVLCDWNQLIYQSAEPLPSHLISEVPRPSTDEKLQLIHDLAHTVEVLHRHSIVVGDMSGKNLIWSTSPVSVFLIDCDSFHFEGRRGMCVHKESPGWIDRELQGRPTSKESDVYKLGVAAYRSLFHRPNGVVDPDMVRATRPDEVPKPLLELIEHSVAPSSRPTSKDWVDTMNDIRRFGGRPSLRRSATPVTGASAVTSTAESSSTPVMAGPVASASSGRPRLQLRPVTPATES